MRALLEAEADCAVIGEAGDGLQTLRLVERLQPDVLVLDVMMPGLNGYEVVKRLRGDDSTGAMPLILLTARAGGGDAKYGYQVGADDYIKKPFSPGELRERVEALLGREPAPGA